MKHDAAISPGPVRSAGALLADEPVFYDQDVVRELLAIKDMAELCGELVVLVVDDLQDSPLNPERVAEVVTEIMTGDLDGPAGEVLAVE